MKIVLFHPVLLPPKDYGGVERVVMWLAKGLSESGHEVYVVAREGSRLPSPIRVLLVSKENNSDSGIFDLLPQATDVVHFMAPPAAATLKKLEELGIPYVVTIHGNGKPGEVFSQNAVFLSKDHAFRHSAQAYVYNGIDPDEYIFSETKSDEYLFLSKTSWKVKNLEGAIELCRRAGVRLAIAGGNRPITTRFFSVFHPNMKWIGPVSGNKKAETLSKAKALLFPVRWPEPFGLVVAEALVSGTPVLCSARGSLPELVSEDVGAICESNEDWIRWLKTDRLSWDPNACRERVLRYFHYLRMTESYLELYLEVISGRFLNQRSPISNSDFK